MAVAVMLCTPASLAKSHAKITHASWLMRAFRGNFRPMQIAIVGLGKMGGNMAERLLGKGHHVDVFDVSPEARARLVAKGASDMPTLESLVAIPGPRVVWVMVPAGEITESVLATLLQTLSAGDIVIEGGNSRYTESQARSANFAAKGVHMLDAGTSGGVWGLQNGYCLMVGGPREAYDHVLPLLRDLAGPEALAYLGTSGAGHYAKMIHNGIEYAMMQSYAEGFELLKAGDFSYDLGQIAALWNHGSVVRSWLLELTERALKEDASLDKVAPYVTDSGEGRWTVEEGVRRAVALPTIAAALFARFNSRNERGFGLRLLSALRNQFGGHAVTSSGGNKP